MIAVAYRPDGRILATGGDDGTIRLYGPKTGKLVRALIGHDDIVRALAWSPDGKRVAVADNKANADLCIWSTETKQVVRTLEAGASTLEEVYVPFLAGNSHARTKSVTARNRPSSTGSSL